MSLNRRPLDPDVQQLIRDAEAQLDFGQSPTPVQIRKDAARFHVWLRGEVDQTLYAINTNDDRVGAVPVRWYGPAPDPDHDLIVFLHGGGWLAGDVESYDPDVRLLQRTTGASVVAVDYRRTPEHTFPAAIDDCVSVVQAVASIPHRNFALVGDSAGGNLALGTALRTRDLDVVDAVLALYPVVDPHAFQNQSYADNGSGYLLTAEQLSMYWGLYAPTDTAREDPAAAVLTADLTGFPPAVIVTAGYDPLRDEGRELATRLAAADVAVTYLPNPGLTHGFQQMVPRISAATDAIRSAYEALICTLGRAGSPRVSPAQLAAQR
ncbi:alpha/beta hydrolase [Microbacterium sp. E-13]|uniref:alpha/beta hydrolase n=1 Tax=Microbacterium sp. E-13 TaxID=3404048 RepID=UPI003CEBE1CA